MYEERNKRNSLSKKVKVYDIQDSNNSSFKLNKKVIKKRYTENNVIA